MEADLTTAAENSMGEARNVSGLDGVRERLVYQKG